MMQGIHTFTREGHPKSLSVTPGAQGSIITPPFIQKMKTYLELEGKLGPKNKDPNPRPILNRPSYNKLSCDQPNQATTPWLERTSGPKKRTLIAKRGYKVRVLTQPVMATPTAPIQSTAPTPTVATTSHPNASDNVHCNIHTGYGKKVSNWTICGSSLPYS